MNKKYTSSIFLVSILIILATVSITLASHTAEPEGASATTQHSVGGRSAAAATQLQAIAGNITGMNFTASASTKAWAGFYGNITGTITLDDSAGQTFYDWTLASPEGEIFAANDSVSSWDNIVCGTLISTNGSGVANDAQGMNITTLEAFFNIESDDVDGFDETFTTLAHPTFFVGANTITTNTCNSTNTYVNDAVQSTPRDFTEVLLKDQSDNDTIIFTAIINDTTQGYNGGTADYQIMVAEDGHSGDVSSTTYYFYVELE